MWELEGEVLLIKYSKLGGPEKLGWEEVLDGQKLGWEEVLDGFEDTKISEQTVVLILKKRWGAKLELWNGRDRRIARFLKRITGIV